MTPRVHEPANAEADLALASMACLARGITATPIPGPTAMRLPDDAGPKSGTKNNKTQQVDEAIAPPSNRLMTKPLGNTDVFADDIIQLGQGGPCRMHATRRHLWHAVDQALAKPAETSEERPEAISIKKPQKETEIGRLARPSC